MGDSKMSDCHHIVQHLQVRAEW